MRRVKKVKKTISWLLTISILAGLLFGMDISAQAETISDNKQEEYIYYTDLFYAYPYYLINDDYFQSYSTSIQHVYDSVHNAYQESAVKLATGLGYALDNITSPTEVMSLISDELGLTDFHYNDALDAANEEVVKNLVSDSLVYSMDKNFGKVARWNNKINSVVSAFNELELTSESGQVQHNAEYYVQEAFDMLQDKGCFSYVSEGLLAKLWVEINDENFSLNECFSIAAKEIEMAKAIVTSLMMEDMRLEIVDDILATQSNNTVLKQGMQRLKNDLTGNFVTYFVGHYLKEKIVDKVFDVIDGIVVDAITGGELAILLNIAKTVFNKVIDYPDVQSVLKWQVLMCYSNDLASGIKDLAKSFSESIFLSDKIIAYENMFVAYDAINKAAMSATTNIENMLDPYAQVYVIRDEAIRNQIENLTIKYGIVEFQIPANLTDEELYMELVADTIVTTTGNIYKLPNKFEISNGITTATIAAKANALASIMKTSVAKTRNVIQTYENTYGDVSLYGEHIKSAKKRIQDTPVNERVILPEDIYSGWTYTLTSSTQLRLQSDTVEKGCYYAFDGYVLGNAYIAGYIVPSGLEIGFAGDVKLGCWDSLTISKDAKFIVKGNFTGNAWAYAEAYRSTITSNGCLEVLGTIYGYANFFGSGKYIVNDVVATSLNFKDATYEIKGSTKNEITYEAARVIISGQESQSINLSGTLKSLDVCATNLSLSPNVTISEYLDFHGNNVAVSNYIDIASTAIVKEGSNYKKLRFPNRYILTNDITATNMYFKGGLTVESGSYVLKGNIDFWYGNGFVVIKEDAALRIEGNYITGTEWAWQPIRTSVVNDGKMTVTGWLMYRWNLGGSGIYNLNNIYSTDSCIKFSGATFNVAGSVTNGNVAIDNITCLNVCGTSSQNLNFTGGIKHLVLTNTVGTTFSSPIQVTTLFEHRQNPFTLYNSGSGSSFVDYDGDGMKDHVDPEPTVGNPCIVTAKSNNEFYGKVSESIINTCGGTTVCITAMPTFKYKFVKWIDASGHTVSTTATYSFVVTKNVDLTAVFEKRSQNIMTVCTGGIIVAPSSAVIESRVTVSVIEDDGYVYAEGSLKYNGTVIEDNGFIMPDEQVVLTAEFVKNESYFLLKEKIREAETFSYESYSASSFENLTSAIIGAKAVLCNDINEPLAETHITSLQKAMDALEKKYITSVEIYEMPDLYMGVKDSINNASIQVVYDNETTEIVPITECQIEGFDGEQLGEQTITVTYQGVICKSIVRVFPPYEVAVREIREDFTYAWTLGFGMSGTLPENDSGLTFDEFNVIVTNAVKGTEECVTGWAFGGWLAEENDNVFIVLLSGPAVPSTEKMKPGEYVVTIPKGTFVSDEGIPMVITEEYRLVYAGDDAWVAACDTHTISENYIVNQEPTATSSGSISYTCEQCGQILENKEVPYLRFSGASLSLQNNLAIKYRVKKSVIDGFYENPYAVFDMGGQETRVTSYTEDGDYYLFEFLNIAPNQMNDIIHATFYGEFNGKKYASETVEYSVSTYCYNMLEKCTSDSHAKLRTLLVDLLNYGAEAQIYTGHHTSDLVNAHLTEEQIAWGTQEDPKLGTVLNTKYIEVENPSVIWKHAILNLNDSITVQIKLATENISGLQVKITDKNRKVLANVPESQLVATDGGYYVNFRNLHAGQMREEIYITAYRADRAVSNTVCYSIESYAYSKQNSDYLNLADLVKAMMKYGNAAYAYNN